MNKGRYVISCQAKQDNSEIKINIVSSCVVFVEMSDVVHSMIKTQGNRLNKLVEEEIK